MGGQVIEVKTPLTHRDYSHLVDQEVGKFFVHIQNVLRKGFDELIISGPAPLDDQQDPPVLHVQQPIFPTGYLQGALPSKVINQ